MHVLLSAGLISRAEAGGVRIHYLKLRRMSGLVVYLFYPEPEWFEDAEGAAMLETIYSHGRDFVMIRYWSHEFGLSEAWEQVKDFLFKMNGSS